MLTDNKWIYLLVLNRSFARNLGNISNYGFDRSASTFIEKPEILILFHQQWAGILCFWQNRAALPRNIYREEDFLRSCDLMSLIEGFQAGPRGSRWERHQNEFAYFNHRISIKCANVLYTLCWRRFWPGYLKTQFKGQYKKVKGHLIMINKQLAGSGCWTRKNSELGRRKTLTLTELYFLNAPINIK